MAAFTYNGGKGHEKKRHGTDISRIPKYWQDLLGGKDAIGRRINSDTADGNAAQGTAVGMLHNAKKK